MPQPLESRSPPIWMRSQLRSIWYWMELDSMRKAQLPSDSSTRWTPSLLLLVNTGGFWDSMKAVMRAQVGILESCTQTLHNIQLQHFDDFRGRKFCPFSHIGLSYCRTLTLAPIDAEQPGVGSTEIDRRERFFSEYKGLIFQMCIIRSFNECYSAVLSSILGSLCNCTVS